MEITINTNGPDTIKIWWQDRDVFGPGQFGPILLNLAEITKRSTNVRNAISKLSNYFERRLTSLPLDVGWEEYASLMSSLQFAGAGLYAALFKGKGEEQLALRKHIEGLSNGSEIELHCHDDQVSIPFGFLTESFNEPPPPSGALSRDHFNHFWVNRFRINARILNCRIKLSQLEIEPEEFRALYALNEKSVLDALEYLKEKLLTEEVERFDLLKTISVHAHHEWGGVSDACKKISKSGSIIFVLAHSDGDKIELGEEEMDSGLFADMIQRERDEEMPELLILNCCASATGDAGKSLLSAVARTGFCGLIGTEAKISNVHALRCGIHLMWNICTKGITLGEAFAEMQADSALFPVNLFYTCYASRDFKLKRPIEWRGGCHA
jgi:hypothetical protein